jgi:aspartate beta-hydroxylase
MNAPPPDGPALARSAADALRRGDARVARDLFLQAARAGQGDVAVFIGLAYACRALQDWPGMSASADRVLALDPSNLRALVMKGDGLEREGDERGAAAYYRTAVLQAPPAERLSPDLAQELRRAREFSEKHARRYDEHMRGWLRERGYQAEQRHTRFGQAVDMLLGQQRAYLQEPRFLYFPQLPQKQFYARADFPWLDAVEAAADDIRAELQGLLQDPVAFVPYPPAGPGAQPVDRGWTACHLWRNGAPVDDVAARCPRTLAALSAAPLARIPGRSPTALFSRLQPRTHIPSRHGMANTRLIVHLPLLVPGKCRLRVGNEVRESVAGQAWVFDDTIEHEATNESDAESVALWFDIARPELSEEENRWLDTLIEGIDAYPSRKSEWEI